MNFFKLFSFVFFVLFFSSVFAVIWNSCPTDNNVITTDVNFVGLSVCNVNDPDANGVIVFGANNITLDCGGMTLNGNGIGYGIYNDSYTNITIRNCDVNNYGTNIYISTSNNVLIDKVKVRNAQYTYDSDYLGSITFYDTNNVTIKDSNFFDNNANYVAALVVEKVSNDSYHYSIHDNNISNNYYGLIMDYLGGDLNFYNNYVNNITDYGLWLGSTTILYMSKVYNNTFTNIISYPLSAYDANIYDNNFSNVRNYSIWLGSYLSDYSYVYNNIINVKDSDSAGGNDAAIWLDSSAKANVYDNNIVSEDSGIYAAGADYSNIYRNKITGSNLSDSYGIYFNGGTYNNIYDNNIVSEAIGVDVAGISYSNIYRNKIIGSNLSNSYGIYLYGEATYNNIYDNNVTAFTSSIGLIGYSQYSGRWYHYNPSNNLIYNNYFDSNAAFTWAGSSTPSGTANDWNSSYDCSSTNIVGGLCKGGNYWVHYSGLDLDNDGVGDTSDVNCESTDAQIVCTGNVPASDFLPLTNNTGLTVTISSPSNNSSTYSNDINIVWSANYPDFVEKYWFKVGNSDWILMDLNTSYHYVLPSNIGLPFTQTFYVKAQTGSLTSRDANSSVASVTVTFLSPSPSGNSCFDLNGFICKENEFCSGTLLPASDSNACCNIVCSSLLPDLIVESFNLNAVENNLVFDVVIKNNGFSDASAFNVDLRKDSVNGKLLAETRVNGLKANEKTKIQFVVSLEKLNFKSFNSNDLMAFFDPGFVFVVVIDPLNEVQESSKVNSVKEFSFESLPLEKKESKEETVKVANYLISFKKELFLNELQSFRVLDEKGNPIENALIVVESLAVGVTDKDGFFKFKVLKEGIFNVKVSINNVEVFSAKMKVKNLLIKLNKSFFLQNDEVIVNILDSIDLKAVKDVSVNVLFPSGKTLVLNAKDGVVSFIASEQGTYTVSVSFADLVVTKTFSVSQANAISVAFNSVLNFIYSTNESLFGLLLILLFVLSLIAGLLAFKFYNSLVIKVFGIKVIEEQKIKHLFLTKSLFALIVFLIPFIVAYYLLVGSGIITAFIELILLIVLVFIFRKK